MLEEKQFDGLYYGLYYNKKEGSGLDQKDVVPGSV